METAGEERVRVSNNLRQLEDAAVLLEDAAKQQSADKISPGFPSRLIAILNESTALNSREDAERLLATGVAMWNAVIAFDNCKTDSKATEALVKIRHVAVDAMYMSITVLGGISAKFNIDKFSLLKFYTVCGQKYATDLCDMEMAEVCLSRAAQFVQSAVDSADSGERDSSDIAHAMFDLLIAQAECAWDKGDSTEAERFVNEASQHLKDLPDEYEYLASVEYNFGLFAYQARETERALKWLKRSMQTRDSKANRDKDLKKQATTARLAGVCLLALQDYEQAWKLMYEAEEMAHDSAGSYLLLKLSVITKHPQAVKFLMQAIDDVESNLDVCIASISLFGDAQRLSDAASGFERLFERFKTDDEAIVCTIGPRYFETLSALGLVKKSLQVLDMCCSAIPNIGVGRDASGDSGNRNVHGEEVKKKQATEFSKWSAILFSAGTAQAGRKDFKSSAMLLDRALKLARLSCADGFVQNESQKARNPVLANETSVCRLAAACALFSFDGIQKASSSVDTAVGAGEDNFHPLELAIEHSNRAKELDPSDFAARVLLFQVYLAAQKPSLAAAELQRASQEIAEFDPGALAEAACTAKDAGSEECVLAALNCILGVEPAELSRKLSLAPNSPPKGFFGTILLSSVDILLGSHGSRSSDHSEALMDRGTHGGIVSQENAEQLRQTLAHGLRGIQNLGMDVAFDEGKENAEKSINYLVDVAWNAGRSAGHNSQHVLWESFFELCYEYCKFLALNASVLNTRRMAKLMSAAANIEMPDGTADRYRKAREQLQEARSMSRRLHDLSTTAARDPIDGLVFVLDARCCVGMYDLNALSRVVELVIETKGLEAGVLEQMASVCHNYDKTDADVKVRCADLTSALLSKASNLRLEDNDVDVKALSLVLRELLGVELSRASTASRAYSIFSKAIGVLLEHESDYPADERRWLAAIGWDRANIYSRTGQIAEARRWGEGVKLIIAGCVALSTYRPRLDMFLDKLDRGV